MRFIAFACSIVALVAGIAFMVLGFQDGWLLGVNGLCGMGAIVMGIMARDYRLGNAAVIIGAVSIGVCLILSGYQAPADKESIPLP